MVMGKTLGWVVSGQHVRTLIPARSRVEAPL